MRDPRKSRWRTLTVASNIFGLSLFGLPIYPSWSHYFSRKDFVLLFDFCLFGVFEFWSVGLDVFLSKTRPDPSSRAKNRGVLVFRVFLRLRFRRRRRWRRRRWPPTTVFSVKTWTENMEGVAEQLWIFWEEREYFEQMKCWILFLLALGARLWPCGGDKCLHHRDTCH